MILGKEKKKKNGRAASFLQVSWSTCHPPRRPRPNPTERPRGPHSWLSTPQDRHARAPRVHPLSQRHAHTRIGALADTDVRKFQGPWVSNRDPDVTHIMDSRAAAARGRKLPNGPGKRGREGRRRGVGGPRRQRRARLLPPKGGERPSEPRLQGRRAALFTNKAVGGGEGVPGRKDPATTLPSTPLWGAPAFGGPLRAQGTHAPRVAPIPHPLPARGRNSQGNPGRIPGEKRAPLTSSSESP